MNIPCHNLCLAVFILRSFPLTLSVLIYSITWTISRHLLTWTQIICHTRVNTWPQKQNSRFTEVFTFTSFESELQYKRQLTRWGKFCSIHSFVELHDVLNTKYCISVFHTIHFLVLMFLTSVCGNRSVCVCIIFRQISSGFWQAMSEGFIRKEDSVGMFTIFSAVNVAPHQSKYV